MSQSVFYLLTDLEFGPRSHWEAITHRVPLAWLAFAKLLNTDEGIEEGRGLVG